MAQSFLPEHQGQFDPETVAAFYEKSGLQPVQAPQVAQAMNSANAAGAQTISGEAWSPGKPLVQNPVAVQTPQAKAGGGFNMDWGKFAETMSNAGGDGADGGMRMGSDMNNLYAMAREEDRRKRAGNGPEHFSSAMSLFGSFFGGGAGGMAGAAGGMMGKK